MGGRQLDVAAEFSRWLEATFSASVKEALTRPSILDFLKDKPMIYDYKCPSCGKEFAVEKAMKDYVPGEQPACPDCETPSDRKIPTPTFILQGGGWYKDGY